MLDNRDKLNRNYRDMLKTLIAHHYQILQPPQQEHFNLYIEVNLHKKARYSARILCNYGV